MHAHLWKVIIELIVGCLIQDALSTIVVEGISILDELQVVWDRNES